MDSYIDQFSSETEGAPRAAVKRLSRAIEATLVESTVNGSDWDTLYTARMARDIMWEGDKSINLDEFVPISQTYVVFFFFFLLFPNSPQSRRSLFYSEPHPQLQVCETVSPGILLPPPIYAPH